MAKNGFGRRFHDLEYFEVGFFFHIPWIRYKFEGTVTNQKVKIKKEENINLM